MKEINQRVLKTEGLINHITERLEAEKRSLGEDRNYKYEIVYVPMGVISGENGTVAILSPVKGLIK